MPSNSRTSELSDILTRLSTAESEIAKLREFRHRYASESVGLLLKVEAMEVKVKQLFDAAAEAHSDHAAISHELDVLLTELREFMKTVGLKHAEYDKERAWAAKLLWPVVIALATAFALGVAALLAYLWPLVK